MIAERYRIEERIGAGGMGVVWRGTDVELGRVVALKRSRSGDSGQLRREARIGAGVLHPHVITVFDAVTDSDERWLVMEYLPSRSVTAVLVADGPLPAAWVARIGAQIADALAAMHAVGIVHRDITPANVLVTEDGDAKLTDLGIARWAEATVTGGAQECGSPGYVAPEVADGCEAGPESDVFALGATLFAAVEGVSPWGGAEAGPFVQLRRAAAFQVEPTRRDGALTPLIEALMSRAPGDRPTAAEARDLLGAIVAGDAPPITPRAHSRPARRFRRARQVPRTRRLRRPGGMVGALAAAAVLVAALVIVLPRATGPMTATAQGSAALVAGAVGDPRTANPCALLDPASTGRFGISYMEPNLGPWSRCELDVDLDRLPGTQHSSVVAVTLDLQAKEDYPSRPPVPGRLGTLERFDAVGNSCTRSISLPSLDRVVIEAHHVEARPADLCAIADAAALAAFDVLNQGPIPRRTTAFPARSVTGLNACSLLSTAQVAAVPTDRNRVEPGFANWSCDWGGDGFRDKQVSVRFGREWPMAGDSEVDTRPVPLGDHIGFSSIVSEGGTANECRITIVNQTYVPAVPSISGLPPKRDETVEVAVGDNGASGDGESMCAPATVLAREVTARLPRA